MIRFRIDVKPNSLDGTPPLARRFHNAVHTVHYPSTRRQNDRVGKIGGINQPHMLDESAPRARFIVAGPRFVELSDRFERDLLARQSTRELHQSVHIPSQEATRRRPKVVLLAHVRVRCRDAINLYRCVSRVKLAWTEGK